MQVDELLRAARPAAPKSLERDVLARLARPRRAPIVIGGLVAVAAIVCIVWLSRREGVVVMTPDARQVTGLPPDAGPTPIDAAPPAPPPVADWEHLTALFQTIERDHRAAIAACGGTGAITIVVARQRDGSALPSHPLLGIGGRGPTPRERCLVAAVSKIKLPAMPAGLISVSFGFPLVAGAPPVAHAWEAPLQTLDKQVRDSSIATCQRGTLTVVADRSPPHDPRVWLPFFQFSTEPDRGSAKVACARRAFGKHGFPPLPSFVGEVQAHVVIP